MNKLFITVNADWFFLSHRKDLALAAKKAGYDVTIITTETGKMKVIRDLGLKTIEMPMNRTGMNLFQELRTLAFFYKLYKKEKPDVVHHVGLKPMMWGGLAAKLVKTNGVVNAVSGLGFLFNPGQKPSLVAKMVLKLLGFSQNRKNLFVIFQNHENKQYFLDHHVVKDEQCVFIKGSGVDLSDFNYTPEPEGGKLKVIFTSRMIVEKGVFVLTDAAEILRKKYENSVEFLLCGGLNDNPNSLTEDDLNKVTDNNYIKWLGYRTDVRDLLKASHIVAFPSYYGEGIPKSLIEATAIGRPIITTNSVGCKDTVEDGKNGFLIPIKDSKSLADKLDLLLQNKELRLQMGRYSREIAEKYFSLDVVIKKHLDTYNSLIR